MGERERIRLSYAAAEVAGQLVFCVISFYILKFYTDVARIPAAAAGAILLAARLIDAVDAPLWGIIFERTRSRWGRSRPWFLWLSAPFAVSGVLTFFTPQAPVRTRIACALVTYAVSSILYTGVNTPVTSILGALTDDARERVALVSFRMFGSKLGVLLVNLTVLPLVGWLGHGDDRRGFLLVMPIYAAGTTLLYLLAFGNLRERLAPEPRRAGAGAGLAALGNNPPWMIIFWSSLLFWIAFIARISTAPYLFEYVLGRPGLIPLANGLDIVSLAAIPALPALCRRISKRNVWGLGLLGCAGAQSVVLAGVLAGSAGLVIAGWALGFLASGPAMAMPLSLLSDSVDYGEWSSGVRAPGLLTALGAAFCLKAGSGIGGALPAWILARSGYRPGAAQGAGALAGIELAAIALPAVGYALAAVPVFFYRRYELREAEIRRDLDRRRRLAAAPATLVNE